jgi:hypothetical protein
VLNRQYFRVKTKKSLMKIVTGVVSILVVLAIAGTSVVVGCDSLQLKPSEVVNTLIAIFASLGALISATLVVASYLQTNKAFVESQRPHLLVFVESLKQEGIHYHNITNNRFDDLSISVVIFANNREYDLSNLFRNNMTMIGQDKRQRSFLTFDEVNKHGLDIQNTAKSGREVKLKVGYRYTFNGELDIVNAQEYLWNAVVEDWQIN